MCRHSLLEEMDSRQRCITCIECCISVKFSFLLNGALLVSFRFSDVQDQGITLPIPLCWLSRCLAV